LKKNKVITIAAVPFSQNLGDGIIHEALCHSIINIDKTIKINTLDIAGRRSLIFSDKKKILNSFFLKFVIYFPKLIKYLLLFIYFEFLHNLKNKKYFRSAIKKSDFVIIGGGQLFSDVDLNFPIKLNCLLREIILFNKKTYVYGVGVSNKVSKIAVFLFSRLLNHSLISEIFVRDFASTKNTINLYSKKSYEVWDPGILISEKYSKLSVQKNKYIGLNITNPINLMYSGDINTKIDYLDFYFKIITHLVKKKKQILLFTNGAIEDEEFKNTLFQNFKSNFNNSLTNCSRPKSTLELVNIISSSEFIISHRLHANIIAYSYKIPSVAIIWDNKISGFFKKINREKFVLDLNSPNWYPTFKKMLTCKHFNIDIKTHTINLKDAMHQIKNLVFKINNENSDSS